MKISTRRISAFVLLGAGLTAAGPSAAQTTPPAHDHAAMQHASAPVSPAPLHDFTPADVAFMQGMIPHHAQALEMTALVQARTQDRGLRLLAERIEVSQRDEILWMQNWLRARGQEAPEVIGTHAGHGAMHHLMPGMLTPEQMADLAASTGTGFVRRFLVYMTGHHEGALIMVDTLFATPGAAQTTSVYQYATDIDADQRADIMRMQAMLLALPPEEAPQPGAADHRHH